MSVLRYGTRTAAGRRVDCGARKRAGMDATNTASAGAHLALGLSFEKIVELEGRDKTTSVIHVKIT